MIDKERQVNVNIKQMPDWQTYSSFMSRLIGEGQGVPCVAFNYESGIFEENGLCMSGVTSLRRHFELPDRGILTDFLDGLANGSDKVKNPVVLNLDSGELERAA